MKFLKFAVALLFWISILVAIVAYLHFHDFTNAYKALKTLNQDQPLSRLEVIMDYFRHSDQWNKIYLTIIISVLLVLFVINDYWVKTRIKHAMKKMQEFSYYTGVLGWCIHKSAAALLVLIQFVAIIHFTVVSTTEPYIFSLSHVVEKKKYGLLLGTNKTLADNKTPNLYYEYRIDAAERLYKSGKVEKIIISGDFDEKKNYNEPLDMMRDLMRRGVPGSALELDYAGFRTLDSVVRLRYEYGINNVVIITQKFHLQRALFLAQFYNIDAIGFQAQGTMTKSMIQRELFAKPRVIMDIFVFNMQPKKGRTTAARQQIQFAKPQHKTLVLSVIMLLLITAWFFMNSLKFQRY